MAHTADDLGIGNGELTGALTHHADAAAKVFLALAVAVQDLGIADMHHRIQTVDQNVTAALAGKTACIAATLTDGAAGHLQRAHHHDVAAVVVGIALGDLATGNIHHAVVVNIATVEDGLTSQNGAAGHIHSGDAGIVTFQVHIAAQTGTAVLHGAAGHIEGAANFHIHSAALAEQFQFLRLGSFGGFGGCRLGSLGSCRLGRLGGLFCGGICRSRIHRDILGGVKGVANGSATGDRAALHVQHAAVFHIENSAVGNILKADGSAVHSTTADRDSTFHQEHAGHIGAGAEGTGCDHAAHAVLGIADGQLATGGNVKQIAQLGLLSTLDGVAVQMQPQLTCNGDTLGQLHIGGQIVVAAFGQTCLLPGLKGHFCTAQGCSDRTHGGLGSGFYSAALCAAAGKEHYSKQDTQ